VIEQDWRDIINSRKAECQYRRNQWLIPRYEGFERRVRRRLAQELESFRSISVQEADELTSLLIRGRESLQRSSSQHQDTLTMAPRAAPTVIVTPGDMPAHSIGTDIIMGNIARETRASASDLAMRRQMEAEETMEANLCGPAAAVLDGAEASGAAISESQLALEKNKVENAIRTLRTTVEALTLKTKSDLEDMSKRIADEHDLESTELAENNVVMALTSCCNQAIRHYHACIVQANQISDRIPSSTTKGDFMALLGLVKLISAGVKKVASDSSIDVWK
jgi:hypothetical protein